MTLSSKSAVNNRLSSGNTGNPGISKTTGSIEFSDDSGTKAIVGAPTTVTTAYSLVLPQAIGTEVSNVLQMGTADVLVLQQY